MQKNICKNGSATIPKLFGSDDENYIQIRFKLTEQTARNKPRNLFIGHKGLRKTAFTFPVVFPLSNWVIFSHYSKHTTLAKPADLFLITYYPITVLIKSAV